MGKRAWGIVGITAGSVILGITVLWLVFEQLHKPGQQCQVPIVVNVYGCGGCCCGNGAGSTNVRPKINRAPNTNKGTTLKPNIAPNVVVPDSPCPVPSPVPPAVILPPVVPEGSKGSDNRGQLEFYGPGQGGGNNAPIRQVPELSPLAATGMGLGLVIAAMWRS